MEKKGEIEIWYRSTNQPNWQKLRSVIKPRKRGLGVDVYFANDSRPYKLTPLENGRDWECVNPDGSRQFFYATNIVKVK